MNSSSGEMDSLKGVVQVAKALIKDKPVQVMVQVTLELRYGREDEELMGLQFSNEMVISSKVVYSGNGSNIVQEEKELEQVDETVMAVADKYDCILKPFEIEIGSSLPPSTRLQPTRPYSGSPIGTTYSISVFPSSETTGDNCSKELVDSKETITMVFWVMETFPPVINIRPTVSMSRANMFSDGEIFVHVGQYQLRKDK